MKLKMDIEPLKVDLKPTSKIDFKQLEDDIKLGKHNTIRIISCGLCDYNCKECGFGKL